MGIDLSELTPAPWVHTHYENGHGETKNHYRTDIRGRQMFVNGKEVASEPVCILHSGFVGFEANAKFIALARNAFDVMMRRGWSPERMGDAWIVNDEDNYPLCRPRPGNEILRWPDPFTALVEADKWYKEHIENKGA